MKIKNLILTTVIILGTLSLNAQSRQDKTNSVKFIGKSTKLITANGWMQNKETGKWISNKNVIKDDNSIYGISHEKQNFTWIQFAKILHSDKEYYVLLFEKQTGAYEYPSIFEGWEEWKETDFLVMSKEDYEKIKNNIELKSGENITIKSDMSGSMSNRFKILGGEHSYNEEILLLQINKAIESSSRSTSFIFNSQITDGKDVVRFRIPIIAGYKVDNTINDEYFEVGLSNFKIFLGL